MPNGWRGVAGRACPRRLVSLAATAANEMSLEVAEASCVRHGRGLRRSRSVIRIPRASQRRPHDVIWNDRENLEKYRRYLPNHVLGLEEESSDDESNPNTSAAATPLQPVVLQAFDQPEVSNANEVIPLSSNVLNRRRPSIFKGPDDEEGS